MKPDQSPNYWDCVSRVFTGDAQQSLWRAHSDRVNISLLDDWLGGRQFTDILKTDLSDEAVYQGLYPFLREHARFVHGIAVAVAGILQKRAAKKSRQRFLTLLEKFECLAKLPSRFYTGHFVAVRALKPTQQGSR